MPISPDMVWDLGKAMRKKEEFESARLMDFDFRQRVRATRLLARAFHLDETALIAEIAHHNEDALLDLIAGQHGLPHDDLAQAYRDCLGEARRQLIIERGDPTPNRLG